MLRKVQNYTPFLALSKHKRRDRVVRLKTMIARAKNSRCFLLRDESKQNDQEAYLSFAGSDRSTLWNTRIVTARSAFLQRSLALAFERLDPMLLSDDSEEEFFAKFSPDLQAVKADGGHLSRFLHDRDAWYFAFGGLNSIECGNHIQSLIKEMALLIERESPPEIFESCQSDPKYAYGIGLQIVLDEETITQASIGSAIERFFAMGETDWAASKPVPLERLLKAT